jgi:hypothetical protein
MKKLKLQIDALVVESFTISAQEAPRGTVEALASCNTCQDLDCTAICTGGSCPGGTETGGHSCGGTCGVACGPTESDAAYSCSTGMHGCHTRFDWTGCDWSCVEGACRSYDVYNC